MCKWPESDCRSFPSAGWVAIVEEALRSRCSGEEKRWQWPDSWQSPRAKGEGCVCALQRLQTMSRWTHCAEARHRCKTRSREHIFARLFLKSMHIRRELFWSKVGDGDCKVLSAKATDSDVWPDAWSVKGRREKQCKLSHGETCIIPSGIAEKSASESVIAQTDVDLCLCLPQKCSPPSGTTLVPPPLASAARTTSTPSTPGPSPTPPTA